MRIEASDHGRIRLIFGAAEEGQFGLIPAAMNGALIEINGSCFTLVRATETLSRTREPEVELELEPYSPITYADVPCADPTIEGSPAWVEAQLRGLRVEGE